MQMRRNTPWILAAACGLMILAAACGGAQRLGAGTSELAPAPPADLPWPPPPGPSRQASDFVTQLSGSEWTASGGSVVNESSSLRMSGAAALPWAIYTVAQLSADNELTGIMVMFDEQPGGPGDGTALFVALANYELGAWEWFDPPTQPFSHATGGDPKYRGPAGTGHVAIALAGAGEALVDTVTFTHTGDTGQVAAPQNLTGEVVDVELVELDWDDVEGASGYNVYRSRNADLSAPKWLNDGDGLVAASEYTDESLTKGYYWYWVTAVAGDESDPSNVVQLWAFANNLPAPTNLRVTDRAAESFTAAWDWDGANPGGGFVIYLHTLPDFLITDPAAESRSITYGGTRELPISGREPGVVYYWKMCARAAGFELGRISEEATGSSSGYWTWADVETIAEAPIPFRAVRVGDEMAVAYFNGYSIDVAVRDAGVWTSDTAMVGAANRVFSDTLDLAYSGGTYVVAGGDNSAGDAWAAYGSPGDWTNDRVHGDGDTGLFHPESGKYVAAAASDTELAVMHYDLTGGAVRMHTKQLSGGGWSNTSIRALDPTTTPDHTAAFLGTNLFVLSADALTDELLLGDRDGGWVFSDVRDASTPKITLFLNLLRFQDEWLAAGFNSGGHELHVLNGTTLPWTGQEIADGLGYYVRVAAEGEEAIAIFYGSGQYHFARYSAGWTYERISVPDTTDFDGMCDVLLIGGVPHFFFRDEDDGMIKVARGTPPEE